MLVNMTANDVHVLSMLGIVNKDKATRHVKQVQAMSKDRLKRYDYRKPDNSKAIDSYYKRKNEEDRQALSFLFD